MAEKHLRRYIYIYTDLMTALQTCISRHTMNPFVPLPTSVVKAKKKKKKRS